MIKAINMRNLLSISVQLASAACEIVRDSYMNKDVKQYMKGANDPVTEADFKIQSMLIKGLRMHYPSLNIVGEQETQFEGSIQFDYSKLNFQYLNPSIKFERECPKDEICVWIDPIDNTKGFIQGHPEDVTILIGIAQNNKAEMGVIGVPYKSVDGKAIYQPSVVFGSTTQGFAYEFFPEENKWVELNRPKDKQTPRIVISCNRQSQLENALIKELKAIKLTRGGAGRKIMMVIKEEAEMVAYAMSSTFKWDSCAGEAIIKSLKGHFASQFGDPIIYNPNNRHEPNKDGFLCSFNDQLQHQGIEICKKFMTCL